MTKWSFNKMINKQVIPVRRLVLFSDLLVRVTLVVCVGVVPCGVVCIVRYRGGVIPKLVLYCRIYRCFGHAPAYLLPYEFVQEWLYSL